MENSKRTQYLIKFPQSLKQKHNECPKKTAIYPNYYLKSKLDKLPTLSTNVVEYEISKFLS